MITIRKFNSGDLEFILNHFPYWFMDANKNFVEPILNDWIKGKSSGRIMYARCIMLDEIPVGIISLSEKERYIASFGIAILEGYRGRGIATEAFQLAKNEVKNLGITKIKSSCATGNTASENLHKKLGFKLITKEINNAGREMNRFELDLL